MTRRLPPSRRDTATLDDAIRHLARAGLSQGGPGFLSGKFATAQPATSPSWLDSAGELGDDADEASDTTLFFQDTHRVTTAEADAGVVTMTLTFLPLEHSEHVYWRPGNGGGIYVAGSRWDRNEYVLRLTAEADVLAAGDRITVEYAHLAEQPEVEPAGPLAITVIGTDSQYASMYGGADVTSIPVGSIVGIQEGDLVVVSTYGIIGSVDSRLTFLDSGTYAPTEMKSYAYHYDGNTTPLTFVTSQSVATLVLRGVQIVGAAVKSSGYSDTTLTPTKAGVRATLLVQFVRQGVVMPVLLETLPYVKRVGAGGGNQHAAVAMHTWLSPTGDPDTSPALIIGGGNDVHSYVCFELQQA